MGRKRQRIKVGEEYNVEGLDYDGEKLTCGLCARRYRALNVHVLRTHGLSPDEYRKEFSLNISQPLWTPDLSQRIGEALRERGLVGNNLWGVQPGKSKHNHSNQAKYEMSIGGKGKVMTMTLVKVKAQKNNAKKSQVLDIAYTCAICGNVYYGRRCEKGRQNHYCPECRPKARQMIILQWRIQHPDKVREYTRRYRARIASLN